jgi:iron complex transport system ATP-binding protein
MWDGRPIRDYSAIQRAKVVSWMGAHAPAAFEVPVYQVLEMARYAQWWQPLTTADHHAIAKAVAMTGIESLLDRSFNALSEGQQQLVQLTRVLAQQSRFLLLDEAASHLDFEHVRHVLGILRTLHRQMGVTVVLVSHQLGLLSACTQRVILLGQGHIVADGPTATVLTDANLQLTFQTTVGFERTATGTIVPLYE